MLQTTTVGSLPKPDWLAEPRKLWAPWRLEGDELAFDFQEKEAVH